jgi:hypothetical protein
MRLKLADEKYYIFENMRLAFIQRKKEFYKQKSEKLK